MSKTDERVIGDTPIFEALREEFDFDRLLEDLVEEPKQAD
ncbi:hypothetical protein GCM10017786_53870 [Amycolatopsis deserti]|uniref:Uncharacterized protein n=1 Tax=Amycolatopsis deserti TaxID=185696 RepID=A0ABQ3JDG9_9PSEU|nr:hypothetical protein GCM10017786_53870 [Amycolatopsis deserti]